MRPRPPAPARAEKSPAQARAERRVRALEEPLDVRARPDHRFLRVEVRNPAHGTRYEVVLPAYPDRSAGFCTCTDFARRGIGTCKHLESAYLWAEEHPETAAHRAPGPAMEPTWVEIDRRLRSAPKALVPAAQRIRKAGSVLSE